jgi:PPOX class probable F420-dependent enzyme
MNKDVSGEVSTFNALRGHKYCQLITFRRSGAAVKTPVWFGLSGGKLYVKTEKLSGKIKRIRNDPRVQVAACTMRGRILGPGFDARARMLPAGGAKKAAAERVLSRHYGLGRRLFYLSSLPVSRLKGQAPVYLEIVPALEDRDARFSGTEQSSEQA